jgi:hypothetical protein
MNYCSWEPRKKQTHKAKRDLRRRRRRRRKRKDEEIGALEVSNLLLQQSLFLCSLGTQRKRKKSTMAAVGGGQAAPPPKADMAPVLQQLNLASLRTRTQDLHNAISRILHAFTTQPSLKWWVSICFPPRFVCHFFGSSVSRRVKEF